MCTYLVKSPSAQSLESFAIATCSEHGFSEYFQRSTETVERQGRQATAQERTREGSTCGRDSRSKAGNFNEADGEREDWAFLE